MKIKTITTIPILVLLFVLALASISQQTVYAAKQKADPGYRNIFENEICPNLKKKAPNTQLYSRYCTSYIYQKDMDNAVDKICAVHGSGGTKKLSSECSDYKNYQKGTFQVKSGDDPQITGTDPAIKGCTNDKCDFIGKYINPAINLFSFVFGIIAVISLIFGGIQYSMSGGDPQNVTKAKKRITDTIIAIVAYMFLYGFIQFLVPGGLFK